MATRVCIHMMKTMPQAIISTHHKQPNNAPEPTAVIAVSSAIAVNVAVRLWLSFLR